MKNWDKNFYKKRTNLSQRSILFKFKICKLKKLSVKHRKKNWLGNYMKFNNKNKKN